MRHSSPRRTANKKRTAKMTVRSTLILASGMAKPTGSGTYVSDLACRNRAGITVTLSRGFSPHSAARLPKDRRAVRYFHFSNGSIAHKSPNCKEIPVHSNSPRRVASIHRRLFEGVFSHAGQVRQYNITKKEWVLNGDTVTYADWNSIKDTLDYDFATEKQFSYEGLSVDAA